MAKISDVNELVQSLLPDDKEFHSEVRKLIQRRSLAKQLAVLRAAKGVSQQDLATRIGVTQGQISKIEHADDDKLRVRDILDYAKALSVSLVLNIPGDAPFKDAVSMVKHHAFEAKKHLDQMAALAGNDPKFKQGVADFYVEAMINLVALCMDSASKLEPQPKRMLELLHLASPSHPVELVLDTETEARDETATPVC